MFINGPVNVVRLEGKVGNIDKVLYVFMDRHEKPGNETQCTNVSAKDLKTYFLDEMISLKNADRKYDFFLELWPTTLANYKPKGTYERRNNYITEVMKMFRKLFKYDKESNKVSINNMINNVRLHYIDIRDYFEIFASSTIGSIIDTLDRTRDYQDTVKKLAIKLKGAIEDIVSIVKNPKKTKTTSVIIPTKVALNIGAINNFSYRLKNTYDHEEIKDKMIDYLNETMPYATKTINSINKPS